MKKFSYLDQVSFQKSKLSNTYPLMSSNPDNNLDDELSNIIDDSEGDSVDQLKEGIVEAGIPPEIAEQSTDSVDESFSIDDFESELQVSDKSDQNGHSVPESSEIEAPTISEVESHSTSNPESLGGVSEFRESLSELSRQVELDRLTFLHGKISESGKKIPSLNEIASDIKGSTPMFPEGDCDVYNKRPSSRLDGWIAGLSFGSNRRAKKFQK